MNFLALLKGLLPKSAPALAPAPRHGRVLCSNPHGFHHMAYVEWGDPDNPKVLVCVHGLTRNGRDFDFLARELAREYRVVCPDVVGRGHSDWLAQPLDYGFPLYVSDLLTLIARLNVESVDWVGTSMGGLIGMLIACHTGSPIRRLVLNDIGPSITAESLRRIGTYLGNAPGFASVAEAEAYLRDINASFGPLTDAQWRHLAEHSVKPADGGYGMIYDPGIGEVFRVTPILASVDLWSLYDNITCPTLVVRGQESDLLNLDTAAAMRTRGPRAELVEFSGVGHAPALMDPAQIEAVADFLLRA